jgi:hypothetical protein
MPPCRRYLHATSSRVHAGSTVVPLTGDPLPAKGWHSSGNPLPGGSPLQMAKFAMVISGGANGISIFRPYPSLNPFRGV